MQRRHFLLCGGAIVSDRAIASPDQTWHDHARGRALPLRIRWPDGDVPCALVLHSHGLGGSRSGGGAWGQAWRDAGIAVLHVQHPGSDSEVARGGLRALRQAADAEQLAARVADMRFVLDEVAHRQREADGPWRRVRIDAVGASGHSFGAHTVQALAGQRFRSRATGFAEPRFGAFVAFSPSPARHGTQSVTEQFGAVARPFMAVTGSNDGDPLANALTGNDRARVYEGLPSAQGRRALLWLDGADHMTFGGNTEAGIVARRRALARPAPALNQEAAHHALVARMTTLWWRAHLLGDTAAAAELRAPTGLGAQDRWRMD